MMITRLSAVFLFFLAVAIGPVSGAEKNTVFPSKTWQQATPESQGVAAVKLQAALDYLHAAGGKNVVGSEAEIIDQALLEKERFPLFENLGDEWERIRH
ncbi:MAG: hypothetical protein JXR73_21295 [Candidatus Omnitrophica bacterium]|nr:hypothetical protein [Candidatus Omnitrophota bacterium]